MAIKNPDFKVKHGLQVGGVSTFVGGLTSNANALFDTDVVIDGDLTVNGDTVTLNTTAIEVEDPLLSLGAGNTTDTKDIGFYGEYGSSGTKYAGFFRDAGTDVFKLFTGATTDPGTGNVDGVLNKASLSADLKGIADEAIQFDNPLSLTFSNIGMLSGTVTFGGNEGSVPWAAYLRAQSVSATELFDGAVTETKLLSSSSTDSVRAVGTNHVKNLSIVADKLAVDSVTNAKIEDGAVTVDKLGTNAVTNVKVADSAIDTAELSAEAVTNAKIHPFTIDASQKLSAASITQSEMAVDSVGYAQMRANSIDTAELSAEAVEDAKIAPNTITASDKLVLGSIDTDKLADDVVTSAKLDSTSSSEAVVTNTIRDLNVTTGKLAANAVTDAKLESHASTDANRAVGTDHIKDDAVTNTKILSSFIKINGNEVQLGNDILVSGLSSINDSASIDLGLTGTAGQQVLSADVRIAETTAATYSPGTDNPGNTTAATTMEIVSTASISGIRILDLGIRSQHISDSAVVTRTINDSAVTRAKILDGAVNDAKIDLDYAKFTTLTDTCSTTATTLDNSLTADYRSVNYYVQAKRGGDYQSSYITLLHDSNDVWIMEHGMVHTTTDPFMTFDATMSGNAMHLVGNTSTGEATIKALKTAMED